MVTIMSNAVGMWFDHENLGSNSKLKPVTRKYRIHDGVIDYYAVLLFAITHSFFLSAAQTGRRWTIVKLHRYDGKQREKLRLHSGANSFVTELAFPTITENVHVFKPSVDIKVIEQATVKFVKSFPIDFKGPKDAPDQEL